jgi:glucokinase
VLDKVTHSIESNQEEKMNELTLVLDIGGTKILGAIVDEHSKIIMTEKIPSKAGKGKAEVITQINELIKTLLKESESRFTDVKIRAIGLGCPGVIEEGTVLFSPNLPLKNYPLKDTLSETFKVPVFLGNDATVSMLGEWKFGAAAGLTDVIGIFVGTGIGGGLVLGGKIYEGAYGAGSEIGHMIIDPEGPFCGCGAKGCLESVSSKTGMMKEIKKQLRRGRNSYLKKFFEKDSGILKSGMLKEALEEKDELTMEIIDQACRYLGVATASLINLLNPEMVVFGGGIISSLGEYMLPLIKRSANKYAIIKNFEEAVIVGTALEDHACLMGAYALTL